MHRRPLILTTMLNGFIGIMPWELCPEIFQSDSRAQKIDFSGLKGQFDAKGPILGNWHIFPTKMGHCWVLENKIGLK